MNDRASDILINTLVTHNPPGDLRGKFPCCPALWFPDVVRRDSCSPAYLSRGHVTGNEVALKQKELGTKPAALFDLDEPAQVLALPPACSPGSRLRACEDNGEMRFN